MSTSAPQWPAPNAPAPAAKKRSRLPLNLLVGALIFFVGCGTGRVAAGGGNTETAARPAATVTETATETTTETVTETAAGGGDERVAELEEANADLQAQLTAAQAAPTVAAAPEPEPEPEAPAAATATFSDGIYIVGTDIAPGTYRTGGGEFCSTIQYPDLDRDIMDSLGAAQGDGPMILEIATVGSVVESVGGCTWTAG